ncbi:cytochrome P450 2C42-like isoform X1 [Lingula anatina]|uniref:Cytochrome P450 2C42-like isoform X1 n=1 Tax=Lingula anatina TaxID=7574 RepID=A0A1S3JIR6_LINAN|nr:cytochrome P450 2C42-like isoform X1 [Lingula anatina]|eukprot:XP_013410305.1 cytochrome P450 2C42-like isoform X1 [Lingula anatina]
MAVIEWVLREILTSPTTLFIIVVATILFHVFLKEAKYGQNFPSGPWGLPFVGVLPFLGDHPEITMMEWAKKYGKVFSVRMGPETVIMLQGYEAVMDAFSRKATVFSGRPHIPVFDIMNDRGLVVLDYGPAFTAQRQFTMQYIAHANNEKHIDGEVDALLRYIREQRGEPFQFNFPMKATTSNVIGTVLFGSRQEYDDPVFKRLLQVFQKAMLLSGQLSIRQFLPFLSFIPSVDERKAAWGEFSDILNEKLVEHRATYREGTTRGFIDAFIHKIIENENGVQNLFTEADLLPSLLTLYFAGSDTVYLTLSWGMLFLLHHPAVCKRIQDELDREVGKSRRPTLADRQNLPYTNAALMEVQRLNFIAPISGPHKALRTVNFRGYTIPEGTTVLANQWSIMMDEEKWPNPQQFDPSRFLDEFGNVKKNVAWIPFSVGKRSCPGEVLARQEIFLVLTALLQAFSFRSPDGEALPECVGKTGSLYVCPDFNVCAVPRF